jgi:hypothetical protein
MENFPLEPVLIEFSAALALPSVRKVVKIYG